MNQGIYSISRNIRDNLVAWVVFNGADGSIYESHGIKSVTRTATGNYTIELDFAMPSIRWPWFGNCRSDSGSAAFGFVSMGDNDATNSSIVIRTIGATVAPAVAAYDPDEVTFCVIGSE